MNFVAFVNKFILSIHKELIRQNKTKIENVQFGKSFDHVKAYV